MKKIRKTVKVQPETSIPENRTIIRLIKAVRENNLPLPILSCALLDQNTLAVTDLETTIVIPFNSKVEAAVELKDMITVLENYRNGNWETDDKGKIVFTSDGDKIKLTGQDKDGFPKVFSDEKENEKKLGEISQEQIATMVMAMKYKGDDDMRPVMQTIYYCTEICGTDAHRLFWEKVPKKFRLSEPVLFLEKAIKLLNILGGTWQVSQVGVRIHLKHESGAQIIFRTMDGTFPKYKAVIPEESMLITHTKFDSADMQKAIKKARNFWNSTTHLLQLYAEKNNLHIETSNTETDAEYISDMKAELIKGKPMRIGFNGEYLNDILENIEGEVTLKLVASNKAAILNDKFLLMPVMLSEDWAAENLKETMPPSSDTPAATSGTPIQV